MSDGKGYAELLSNYTYVSIYTSWGAMAKRVRQQWPNRPGVRAQTSGKSHVLFGRVATA